MTTKTSTEAFIREQFAIWNRHDAEGVARGYAQDAVVIDPSYAEPLTGREAIQKDAGDFFVAFPDLSVELVKLIVEGDTAVIEGAMKGTHTGPLALPTGLIPATNKPLSFGFAVVSIFDAAGNVREERRYYDVAGQLTQLGLMQ
jgi:steroid delta-isomerase-like uncharacterized protein